MSYSNPKMFDPRLLEYIQKKQYHLENNITPCIPLEKEYGITYGDMPKIKRYLENEPDRENISLPNETTEYPVHEPKIQYKNKLHYDTMEHSDIKHKLKHDPSEKEILNYLNDREEVPVFLSRIIHKNKSNRVYEDTNYPNVCVNKIREQYHNEKPLDQEILNDLQLGMPSHTKKSYGYNNSFENAFQYVDGELQNPDHVVLPFPRGGISCRMENKKQFSREVY